MPAESIADFALVMLAAVAFGVMFGWQVRDAKAEADLEVLQRLAPKRGIQAPPPRCPYCQEDLERLRKAPGLWICEACPELWRIVGRSLDYSQDTDKQLLPQLDKLSRARRRS